MVKNEVIYICPAEPNELGEQERLKAEVLCVYGNTADAQVYESTTGVAVGDPVEQSGRMLSVSLGPGLLGQVYDGLQIPLHDLAARYGVFLPRGVSSDALNQILSVTPPRCQWLRVKPRSTLASPWAGQTHEM